MAPLVPYLMVIGLAVSTVSSAMSASAQMHAARAAENVARRNAVLARKNAETEARLKNREHRRMLGRARAYYSKAGVDPFLDSPLGIVSEAAGEAGFAESRIRLAGEEQARGILNQGRITSAVMRAQAGSTILGAVGGGLQAGATFGALGGFEGMGDSFGSLFGDMGFEFAHSGIGP